MAAENSPECINKRNQIKADINKAYNLCTKQLTSTNVGHEFIQPINLKKEVLTLKFPEQPKDQAVILKEASLTSTYNDSFHWHYNDNDPIDRANSQPGLRFQYIKPYAEQVKVKPPKPHNFPFSEYQDKYPAPQIFPPRSKVVNLRPKYICEVQNSGKTVQPPFKTEEEGFSKHLDIYISTSHFNHHPFIKREIDQYEDKKVDVQKSISTRVKPVYDVSVVKKKYHEKILPKVSRPVPHSGMESEMKGNYRLPVNEMSNFRPLIPIEMPPIISATKAEILSTPAMYHTEYNHLGNNWELSALLNNKPIKL